MTDNERLVLLLSVLDFANISKVNEVFNVRILATTMVLKNVPEGLPFDNKDSMQVWTRKATKREKQNGKELRWQ